MLGRTAAVLLVASLARYGWEARRPAPLLLAGGRDDGPALLAASRRRAAEDSARSRPLGAGETLDPNRASAVELDRLPGVGPAAARAIVAERERSGGFASLEDLLEVPGVGTGTLARMRSHLQLGPPGPRRRPPDRTPAPTRPAPRAPLDVNRATEAELERLPGVGPALAARMLAQRTRLGRFASLEDLLQVPGIGPKTLERLRPLLTVGGS